MGVMPVADKKRVKHKLKMELDGLTEKQLLFCHEFMQDYKLGGAAMRAGFGATVSSSRTMGSRLIKKPEIQRKIKQLMADRMHRLNVTSDRIIKEFADIAFSEDKELRVIDKLKALEMLGRHLKMFTDNIVADVEVTHDLEQSLAERLTGGSKR